MGAIVVLVEPLKYIILISLPDVILAEREVKTPLSVLKLARSKCIIYLRVTSCISTEPIKIDCFEEAI